MDDIVNDPAWLRFLIANDVAIQSPWKEGKVGVTISSRICMGAMDGHRWALVARWLLERSIPLRWIFGPGHCKGAVLHDIERNQDAIAELAPYAERVRATQ